MESTKTPELDDANPQIMDEKRTQVTCLEDGLVVNKRPAALLTRYGWLSTLLFYSSSVIIIGCIGFLVFMWYGTANNPSWHNIMTRNWCLKAISFTSTAIRWCIDIQTGTSLAMLASVALETSSVPDHAAAAVSIMRVGGSGLLRTLLNFVYPVAASSKYISAKRRMNSLRLVLGATLILVTSTVLQFTSTLLLSDVRVQLIPSKEFVHTTAINFGWAYTNISGQEAYGFPGYDLTRSEDVWKMGRPEAFATFAEYTEEPFIHENVSDTGLTLRALLPFDAAERSSIRSYEGKALVLDTRVTCQRPDVKSLKNHYSTNRGMSRITGSLVAPIDTPKLQRPQGSKIYFNCPFDITYQSLYTLCELQNDALITAVVLADDESDDDVVTASYTGGLLSEFREDARNKSGAAFLVLTTTQINSSEFVQHEFEGYQSYDGEPMNITVSFTICFAALESADRNISAISLGNRTEPTARHVDGMYNFSSVRRQLDPLSDLSKEQRGLLTMEKMSWSQPLFRSNLSDTPVDLPTNVYNDNGDVKSIKDHTNVTDRVNNRFNILPYMTDILHIEGDYLLAEEEGYVKQWQSAGVYGNCSLLLGTNIRSETYSFDDEYTEDWYDVCYIESHAFYHELFTYFMGADNRGNIALALQSLFTTFASLAYYDALPNFDRSVEIKLSNWEAHNTPGGKLGKPRSDVPKGLISVACVIGLHLAVVFTVFRFFMVHSTLSRLGDPWQAIAHVASGDEVKPYLHATTRQGVIENLRRPMNVRVGIHPAEDGKAVLKKAST